MAAIQSEFRLNVPDLERFRERFEEDDDADEDDGPRIQWCYGTYLFVPCPCLLLEIRFLILLSFC